MIEKFCLSVAAGERGVKPVKFFPVSSGWSMSALPPEADIRQRIEHVCFVPIADMLGSELGGHDQVEGVASATYAFGI